MESIRTNWKLWLLVSLTLGLAPFLPEPHLFGKVRWVLGDPSGMQMMDWFDLILHGSPWVILLLSLILNLKKTLS